MSYIYKASIIVINYNGKQYVNDLFDSLEKLNTPKKDFEVIIVDNASVDGSLDLIKEKSKVSTLNVKVIESKINTGFAGGNNLGVHHAQGEYIALLNNDTRVDSEWLNALIAKISSDPNIGIVNSKLLFYYDFVRFSIDTIKGLYLNKEIIINGKPYNIQSKFSDLVVVDKKRYYVKCLDTATIFVPLIDGITDYTIEFEVLNKKIDPYDYIELDFDRYNVKKGKQIFKISKDQLAIIKESLIQNAGSAINEFNDGYDIGFGQPDGEQFNKERELQSGCGASIMMRKDDFDKLGGFDERLFTYYEDTDLSFRMRKMGKKIIYEPKSVVRHFHTGSSEEWSPFFTYHVIRNKLIFIYKNISHDVFEKEYRATIRSAIRDRYRTRLRIRAAKDAKRIINGNNDVKY